jgi:hypothetical protein
MGVPGTTRKICKIIDKKNHPPLSDVPLFLPESIRLQGNIHTRAVAEEGGKQRFKEQSKVQNRIGYSLLDDRVSASLGDDQIRPLYNDNCHKISGLACVFQDFSIGESLQENGKIGIPF